MAPRLKPTLSKKHKEAIRQAALARHAERKAAGLASPAGLPYKTAEVVAPATLPESAPPMAVPPEPVPAALPLPTPNPALQPPVASPRAAFVAWLRGKEGISASDTRMSTDPVRLGAELEDRLWVAFQAGLAEGRGA